MHSDWQVVPPKIPGELKRVQFEEVLLIFTATDTYVAGERKDVKAYLKRHKIPPEKRKTANGRF